GWKWPAVGVMSLLLLVFGAHLAWERHRNTLHTSKGAIRIGMTEDEVHTLLGPYSYFASSVKMSGFNRFWIVDSSWAVSVCYDDNCRVASAELFPLALLGGQPKSSIPRPSLAEHVRSWLGKREE